MYFDHFDKVLKLSLRFCTSVVFVYNIFVNATYLTEITELCFDLSHFTVMKRARNYQQGLPYTGIYPIPNCDEDQVILSLEKAWTQK